MRQSTGHAKAMRIFLSSVQTSLFLFLLLFIENCPKHAFFVSGDDTNGLPNPPDRPTFVAKTVTSSTATLTWAPVQTDSSPVVDSFEVQFKPISETGQRSL